MLEKNDTLLQQIRNLPKNPGVYHYFDVNGKLLYIGKAKVLANRVKSYFRFSPHLKANPTLNLRLDKMINETHSLHYIVVKSEHDALILENSLIKQLNPKYNILLRDDKTFPYLYYNTSEKYPRIELTRKVIKSKDIHYFGPYSIGARDILESVYELTSLVQKKSCLSSKKACLFYQLNKCLAPCEFDVKKELYHIELDKAINFIENKKTLIKQLIKTMHQYAEDLRFEEAGVLRDKIERIQKSEIKSDIDFASNENYDIFALYQSKERVVVIKLFMRAGKIISSSHKSTLINENFDLDEAFERVLLEYYSNECPPIIAPILISYDFENRLLIQEHLTKLFNKKASLLVPKQGKKRELVDLALLNAKEILKNDVKVNETLLHNLQTLLELDNLPQRIETFDNSHLGSVATVGAMVVYDEGNFDKSSYRQYHLEAKDEYAQMRETLTKRVESFDKNPPPDLWVIDGGTTLLSLAKDIIDSHGVNLDVIAISKEKIDARSHRAKGKANDILHTPLKSIKLSADDKRLQLMQRLRDEAHRFAITFHKKTKLKMDKESKLLNIKGISQAKVQKLLAYFGTFENISKADEEEITSILNIKDAKIIKLVYK